MVSSMSAREEMLEYIDVINFGFAYFDVVLTDEGKKCSHFNE